MSELKIAVVGLGKIGLPLAVQFALRGNVVIGADINPATVRQVNEGNEPFPGECGLLPALREVVASGNLSATTETTIAVTDSDVTVVVVPLFVGSDGHPDFTSIDAATLAIARGLKPGALVSYETTVPVGTTRQRFAQMLELGSGLVAGKDFHLAFSPERVLAGRVFSDLRRYPKLVGGLTPTCGLQAIKFYESVLEFDDRPDLLRPNGVWDLGSCEASEMAKLAETTYRDVNIGLANQFAQFAARNDIDIYQVIQACNSQPFSHIHQPGVAVGGHCIPIYPQMYLWNDPSATIVRSARQVNWGMPAYSIDILEKCHGSLEGQKVTILGLSYRGGVKETAFSGAFELVSILESRGAITSVHDPLYTADEIRSLSMVPYEFGNHVDAAIIQANHTEYSELTPLMLPRVRTILNGRNIDLGQLIGACRIVRIDGT